MCMSQDIVRIWMIEFDETLVIHQIRKLSSAKDTRYMVCRNVQSIFSVKCWQTRLVFRLIVIRLAISLHSYNVITS